MKQQINEFVDFKNNGENEALIKRKEIKNESGC